EGAVVELARDDLARKRFLKMAGKTMGSAAAATALGSFIAACGSSSSSSKAGAAASTATSTSGAATTAGDLQIVNYALTLEYLEAQFYADVIASGVIKDPAIGSVAKKFGETEQQHVDALIATVKQLGGTPAAKPKASFQSVIDGGPKMILETAATVENLGAAAYLGQAGRIKSKEILAAALSIHSVEARHAAALNAVVGRGFMGSDPLSGSIPDGAFAKPMAMADVLKAVKPFLTA
ncbi:MAG: Twin-arginine translocation pathway signal, partial [Solirubrobacterales bacterium]|nr:Twin-arginine translocation pathway signal [Solirubrobacterales bacterium]